MTKADIVNRVANATGVTKLETEILVEGFFKTIAAALASGEHIEIRGFGTFKTKKRKSRMARNPRTGEQVVLEEHFVPTFKASRELRALIDEHQKSAEPAEVSQSQD
jgi:DNA-binding protein HU-beta